MKLTKLIKFYRGLIILAFCISYPMSAFAGTSPYGSLLDDNSRNEATSKLDEHKKDESMPEIQPPNPEQELEKDKNKDMKETAEDEASLKNLFKDATFESFEPQDDVAVEIVNESYLEPR
ncbi:MAG: hypothetical protein KKE11_02805 [Gammaproteobacteria bacterium]|nr:hypothetical protein [Gammaproteobacteria bacterium]